jgi:PAS domain-containing protein
MQDTTVPKQVEEVNLASESLYRALFERAPVGIIIGSVEGTCIDANHSMCRMLSMTGVNLDVTEQRRAEEARSAEKRDPSEQTSEAGRGL